MNSVDIYRKSTFFGKVEKIKVDSLRRKNLGLNLSTVHIAILKSQGSSKNGLFNVAWLQKGIGKLEKSELVCFGYVRSSVGGLFHV